MTYSVWETDSANILGTFESEAEALALVRDIAARMGAAYVDTFSLTTTNADGFVEGIAAGAELLALALRHPAAPR